MMRFPMFLTGLMVLALVVCSGKAEECELETEEE